MALFKLETDCATYVVEADGASEAIAAFKDKVTSFTVFEVEVVPKGTAVTFHKHIS